MQYLITFLEGFISFISPCMLPMLPIYVSYFSHRDDETETAKKSRTLIKAIAFVLGFTIIFVLLGVFAGTLGRLLTRYGTAVNIVSGIIVVILGLSYLEVIRLPFFKGITKAVKITGVFSAFLFGIVYSVSLTPCIGAFLGSALMMASNSGSTMTGMLLLLCYSLGLGIPFVISALLLDKLGGAFTFIKSRYKVINTICGIFLIIIGILMMTGLMSSLMKLFM